MIIFNIIINHSYAFSSGKTPVTTNCDKGKGVINKSLVVVSGQLAVRRGIFGIPELAPGDVGCGILLLMLVDEVVDISVSGA